MSHPLCYCLAHLYGSCLLLISRPRASIVRTAPSRFWHATLLLLTALSMMSAAEPSPIPKRFSAYIGGFMGASYKLELNDGVLTYTTFGGGHTNPKHATIKPTEAQWREFRQTLDDLKV